MPSFAQRLGYREIRSVVQREGLDHETRTVLWNVIAILPEKLDYHLDTTEDNLLMSMWMSQFKMARDEFTSDRKVWALIKSSILNDEWWEVLDLVEALIKRLDAAKTIYSMEIPPLLVDALNVSFEKYLVGYRFIGHEITQIDSAVEAEAVTAAIDSSAPISGARHSLERAVELLADRQSPDYPNSIKESISAVEAVVKKVTGEGTLGAGLGKLEAAGIIIHPALKAAWSKMYGWTSDADGIRHAGVEAADADQALAKYMLVTCSAFVSLVLEEGRKAGLVE